MLRSFKTGKASIMLLVLFQLITLVPKAQEIYNAKNDLQFVINGTSTLHDWSMKSSNGECNATFTYGTAGQLTGLTFLSLAMPAEALKSDHSSMDKNAYKALKTSQYNTILFNLTSASIAADGTIKCTGKLTIAGVTQETVVIGKARVNADKSIIISGTQKISMKDFKIDPPTFMFGAVKTGNDIVLTFDVLFKRK